MFISYDQSIMINRPNLAPTLTSSFLPIWFEGSEGGIF